MNLDSGVAPTSCCVLQVMDGPVPPNRWALEDNAAWASTVAQDVLRVCAGHSATCERRLGAVAHTPRFLMDAIIDGTLPCLAELPWLTQHRAALYTNFMTASQYAHILMGPFWARVERCSASDVEQLNFFNTQRQALEPSAPKPPFYSYGLSIIIGASEVRYGLAMGQLGPDGSCSPIAAPNRSCFPQTKPATLHMASSDSICTPARTSNRFHTRTSCCILAGVLFCRPTQGDHIQPTGGTDRPAVCNRWRGDACLARP